MIRFMYQAMAENAWKERRMENFLWAYMNYLNGQRERELEQKKDAEVTRLPDEMFEEYLQLRKNETKNGKEIFFSKYKQYFEKLSIYKHLVYYYETEWERVWEEHVRERNIEEAVDFLFCNSDKNTYDKNSKNGNPVLLYQGGQREMDYSHDFSDIEERMQMAKKAIEMHKFSGSTPITKEMITKQLGEQKGQEELFCYHSKVVLGSSKDGYDYFRIQYVDKRKPWCIVRQYGKEHVRRIPNNKYGYAGIDLIINNNRKKK